MEEPQQNMSRPVSRSSTSSATENDELVKRLEVQGQRKKELGLLIGQLHSMMDDEPVEQLKHKLKEMGIVQSENERLRGEISGYEDKVLQIETDAAQQVQSVLDTNEKLQKELVKLSRDLSSVESELSDQKRLCKEKKWETEEKVRKMEGELQAASSVSRQKAEAFERLCSQLKDEQQTKFAIVEKFKTVSIQLDDMVEQNESLKTEKVNVSTHLWNLTEKLKDISVRLEKSSAEASASNADNHKLEADLDNCRRKLEKQTNTSVVYKNELDETKESLKDSVFRLNSTNAQLEKLTKAAEKSHNEGQTRNKELNEKLQIASVDLASAKTIINELNEKVASNNAMRKKIVEQATVFSSTKKRNESLKAEVKELQGLLQASNEQANHLDKSVDMLRAEKAAFESRCHASEAERDASVEKIEEMKGVHDGMLEEMKILEASFMQTKEALLENTVSLDTFRNENGRLLKKIEEDTKSFETNMSTLLLKNKHLSEQLSVCSHERNEYLEEMNITKSALEEGENVLSGLRGDVATAKNEHNKMSQTISELHTQIKNSDSEKARMHRLVAKMEGEKRDMLVELKEKENEFDSVQQEVGDLQEKLEGRIKEKVLNEERLTKALQAAQTSYDECKQKTQSLETDLENSRRVLRDTKDELQDIKNLMKKVTKEHANNTITFNEKYSSMETLLKAKKVENDEILNQIALKRAELKDCNTENRKLLVDIKQNQDNTESRERALRGELSNITDQRDQAQTQIKKAVESNDVLEQKVQILQDDLDEMEVQRTAIQAQLAAETDARRRLTSEVERERSKQQRLQQQFQVDIDNARQDLVAMRRRAEEGERLASEQRQRNESLYAEFDKSKADMRKQMDSILGAQASEESRLQSDMDDMSDLLSKSQEDLKNEEQHSAEMRRQLESLKLEIEKERMAVSKTQRKEVEAREELVTLEGQLNRCRQERNDDSQRLEEKLALMRKEKIDSCKELEKMRLNLRASSREADELRRQMHSLRAEEEWKKQEIARMQEGAKAQVTSKEKEMTEALRKEEEKRKETERQAYQHHTSTIQEIEQLRRRNQDLAESVQSLTHALQTLTGSGEKRGAHKRKNRTNKRSRQAADKQNNASSEHMGVKRTKNLSTKAHANFNPLKEKQLNGGKSARKQGKETARRNDVTDALRKRGWRPQEEENIHGAPCSEQTQGNESPVMSHTSASKIRKLARQDSSNLQRLEKRAPRSAPSQGNSALPSVGRGGGAR